LAAVAIVLVGASPMLAAAADRAEITWSERVAAIFQERCQSCHRPGDIAPMSLLTYDEARPWAKSIRKVVSEKTMPPWQADTAPGVFENDMSLTAGEIATIVDWVDRGAPQGDPNLAPPAKVFGAGGWKSGKPDLEFEMAETYTLPAAVDDEYRCFVIPARFDADTWYEGFELRPGNPRVVHHAVAWGITGDLAVKRDRETPEPGFLCGPDDPGVAELHGMGMIAGWVPGNQQTWSNDDGVASRIPGGVATIVMQIHYHNATGEDQPDRTAVAFYLARETVQKEPRAEFLGAWGDALFVPAGNPRVEHRTEWTAPQDITLRALVPHMHKLGTDMTVGVTYPDGREETLLSVPRYDFNWQHTYRFREPVKLPKGTIARVVSHHDNSAANPNQGFDPPRDIRFGESTDEEMAFATLAYTLDDEALNVTPAPPVAPATAVAPDAAPAAAKP
jgi:hypothetical protein